MDRFPIVVRDQQFAPSQQQFAPFPFYNNFPYANFYGNFPYQFYPQYPQFPQYSDVPNFIVVTPKQKPKKSKPKVNSTPRPLPKDSMKLIDARSRPQKLRQAVKADIKLVRAVQQPNSKFVVEKFFFAPGRRIAELSTSETVPIKALTNQKIQQVKKSQNLQLQKQKIADEEAEEETAMVKVESIGMSAADQPIPDYSGFFPRSVFNHPGSGAEATLILEPNSKAISGNSGTSISTPMSRAILRKGTAVKVLFRPQSVAITGAYGIAHAQADLLLDVIDDE